MRFIFSFTALFWVLQLPASLVYQNGKWQAEGGLGEQLLPKESPRLNAPQLMEKAAQAQELGQSGEALAYYQKVIKSYPSSQQAPEALYQSGRIEQQRHFLERAFRDYDRIVKNYPRYPHYEAVTSAQFEIAQSLAQGAKTRFFFLPWFSSRKLAIEYYESFLKYAPNSPHAPEALLNTGQLYARSGKPDMATDVLDRLMSDYPETPQAPDAFIAMAKIERSMVFGADYDQGANLKARDYYTDLLLLYPLSEQAKQAKVGMEALSEELACSRYKLGYFYWQKRNNPEARVFFREAIALAPDSTIAEKARVALEKIRKRQPAPKGLGEILLGRYKAPRSKKEQTLETRVRKRENQVWSQPGSSIDPRWQRATDAAAL